MKLEEVEIEEEKIKDDDIKKEPTMKLKEYSIINFLFSIKGVDVYFPLEPESKNTSIIVASLETPVKYTLETDVESEYNSTQVIKVNYKIKTSEFIIGIDKGSFSVYEYKDDIIYLNTINQVFDNLDLTFMLKAKLDREKKSNIINITLHMNKELEISVNINHIIVVMDLVDKINEFLDKMKTDNLTVKLKEIIGIKNENENELKKARTLELLEEHRKIDKQNKLLRQETDKINITKYNEIVTYEFIITNISAKFYDVVDGVYQSLFEFSMSNTKIDSFQNSNPRDCSNLVRYLKSTFTHEHKELNTYDKNNFYVYFNIRTKIELKCLNNYLDQWEHFIEPFSINCYYCQFLKRMRPNIEFFAEQMFNINLSLNLAKIFQFAIKKFSMNREEAKKNKEGKLFKNDVIPDAPHYLGYENPILVFENYSGADMEIWFDNIKYDINSDKIIKLKNKQKFELTSSILKNYDVIKENNNLNSTLSYKFCLDKDFINSEKIDEKNLVGNYFNINYHHIDIHDINDSVKISIESCSDNLLCRHVFFNSLISIRNNTKFNEIQLCNNDNTQKIILSDNKRQPIPLSWFLSNKNKNIDLVSNNDSQVLIQNLSKVNDINKSIKFKNGDIILIDVVRYKINLEEYFANKNPSEKKEIYRVDIILSSPISLINNTPYEFITNDNNKILSQKTLDIYSNNFELISEYVKITNEKGKRKKNTEREIIMKILKDIKLQLKYENKIFDAMSYIEEKKSNNEDEKNEEGKAINNFSTYNKNLSVLLKDKNSKSYLICRLFFNNPYEFVSYNNNIYENMKIELNSFKYEIIFDYYFVNRTNLDLYFNNKVIDKVDSKDNLLISAKKNIPVSKILLNNKIKLKGKDDYWSQTFEASALGDEVTLNVKSGKETYRSLGIMIRISKLFAKSITFIIEDKYLIMNDLPFEINIREDKSSKKMTINGNENKVLILTKESLNKKNNFRIGVDNCYSHKFDIDKLGTYDFLIEYDQQIFEQKKIDVNDKLVELNDKKYYPVRCVINTVSKNIVYVLFSYNKNYINQLRNFTTQNIEIILNKDKYAKYIIKPEMTIPLIYSYKDSYQSFETLKIIFSDKSSEIVTLNEIDTLFSGKKKDYIIKIHPENNNSSKCISIYNKNDDNVLEEKQINNDIKKYTKVEGLSMKVFLKGIGVSIIDETPKETFYLSLYDIKLIYKYSNATNILKEMKQYNSITFRLKNLQLDYCLDNSYDIIINPSNQLLPPKPNEKVKEEKSFIEKVFEDKVDETPFLQFVSSQEIRLDKKENEEENKLIYSLYPEIGIIIQEFEIRINTILINSLISIIIQYMLIFFPPEDDNNELSKIMMKIIKKKK